MWFEAYGKLFQRAAKVLTAPLKYLTPLASLAMVLWVLSETVEDRSLEDALAWLDIPARVVGFPVLAVLCVIFGLLGVLGAGWLLLGALVPFGVVSRLFGEVSPAAGLAGAAGGMAIGAFFLYRTWNSFGGWAKFLNSGVLILLTAVLVVWFVASLLKPSRAGASGLAAVLAGIVALQVFYIAGLDDNAKLYVLVASAVVDYALFVLVRNKFRAAQNALRERAEPRVREVLETVGINPNNALDHKPFEFSGGQAQRISIARALIMDPKIIICDEPVSALDVSVQAQILNLLEQMKERYGLSLVFIAHDLAVVKNVSDRVAVMYLGKICEVGDPDTLYANPAHPYTSLLLSAIPHPDPDVDQSGLDRLDGELPSPMDPPSGCRFRTRCPRAADRCASEEPTMRELDDGQYVACHFPLIGEVAP
ncbi:MAG: ABC transporter ATP-binding protein [Actinomycetota bacterium]|nr:ABC transporter ATP-binding protein [Actinomycetota bacterium]